MNEEPNPETVKAMEETDKGKGLHTVGSVEELIEELNEEDENTELKLLKEAVNKHFCTERDHQKRFLGRGRHGGHVDDPTTPGGGGCIYCNMIRLEMENVKLRYEIAEMRKQRNE